MIAATDDPLEIPVLGIGSGKEWPEAVIHVAEGHEATPQTVLHLDGTESFSPYGIKTYKWTVEQPDTSQQALEPHAADPTPTFEANVAGVYTFALGSARSQCSSHWRVVSPTHHANRRGRARARARARARPDHHCRRGHLAAPIR